MHQIQKNIVRVLIYQAVARFSKLRPPHTDSNLFSYHLKALIKEGILQKVAGGYALTPKGLFLVDRISVEKFEPRMQAKLITMAVVSDSQGRVGLQQRTRQPFIGEWTLPSGKVHLGETIQSAAIRELREKAGLVDISLSHVGDSYIHAYQADVLVSSVLAHVFVGRLGAAPHENLLRFVTIKEMSGLQLLPGIRRILAAATVVGNSHFFMELQDFRQD